MGDPQYAAILKRLDGVQARLRRLDARVATCAARKAACEERCRRNEATLHGNGRAGLVSKVYLLMWVLGVVTTAVCGLGAAILGRLP